MKGYAGKGVFSVVCCMFVLLFAFFPISALAVETEEPLSLETPNTALEKTTPSGNPLS